uniref:Uncharacterized protein LOC111114453 n=1 Tax=Crassostrea virginica TaxID=6565 RepID=A0A8B8BYI4_CRAVI|nr:uncharacterized protein LOC111114453 [Crassostrea virginica]
MKEDDGFVPGEMEEYMLLKQLEDRISFFHKGKAFKNPLMVTVKRAELNSVINKLEDPPRLIFVKGDKGFCNTYIIGGGTQIEVSKDLRKALTLLLFAYYVWDLAYPKYYQLLGFLQVYILGDKENKFAISQNYLKFTKMFDDLNV